MKTFTAPLLELAGYEEIQKKYRTKSGMTLIGGCVTSQKTHMIYALSDGCPYTVIVLSDEEKAKKMLEEYRFLEENVCFYPAKDFLFYQADIHGKELVRERIEAIRMMLEKGKDGVTIITTFDAFMDKMVSKENLQKQIMTLKAGDVVDLEQLICQISGLGYDREAQINGPGQFAVRGGILDIYPLTEELPIRMEFWGDEIDSIRTFDVDSQRSVENLQEITIYPGDESKNGKNVSFLDYFPESDTALFLDEPVRLLERGQQVEDEVRKANEMRSLDWEEKGIASEEPQFYSTEEVTKKVNCFSSVGLSALENKHKYFQINEIYNIQTKSVNPYNNSFEMLTKDLSRLKRSKYRVVLISGSRTRAKRLAEDLRDYDLSSFYSDTPEREVKPGEIMVCYGHVEVGYEYPMIKYMVISETDIFGKHKKKKKKRKTYEGQKIQDFTDLKPGDYVVHENHGLGIYRGIEKIEVDKVVKDYMKISYADGGNLYILATQLDLIQKYASADAKKPKLNKLGGQEWNRTKKKVRGAVQQIAKDLVELYATRQEKTGFIYEQDTVWQREFEEMFPFEETEDQLLAIEAVKKDMESPKIMDRLIGCTSLKGSYFNVMGLPVQRIYEELKKF